MCGITGIVAFKNQALSHLEDTKKAVACLKFRGPDNQFVKTFPFASFGHARLSIIDLSAAANQPMTDKTGRYCLVFNGEIYNYLQLKSELQKEGVEFKTNSDTEVLLQLLIKYGEKALQKIDGFFAFAFYDSHLELLIIARDRLGIKPLSYYKDEEKFIFGSELNAILSYNIPKEIDHSSLFEYFRLTYIPAPHSIIKGVQKLLPGEFLRISKSEFHKETYYETRSNPSNFTYTGAVEKLKELLENSVKNRLIADVPLGTFLSGGIDSSVISILASKHIKNLPVFSIGFPDEPYFDETKYAKILAKKIKAEHHIFEISNKEIAEDLYEILANMDEPFADSSAIPVNILSKHTRKHVTVALSGDGADELFGGYNKHSALYKARRENLQNKLMKNGAFLWNKLPASRNNDWLNKVRQAEKYSRGLKLSEEERYWEWACFNSTESTRDLLKRTSELGELKTRQDIYTHKIDPKDFNSILLTDVNLVLPNDMLKKVDMMSMARSLEVRVPFLDHKVVEFAFSLPASFKLNGKQQKRILKDAFADSIPNELLHRAKKGFEVPLSRWLRNDLSELMDVMFNKKFIEEQGLFNFKSILKMRSRLNSVKMGDTPQMLWALLVFQVWYKKHMC